MRGTQSNRLVNGHHYELAGFMRLTICRKHKDFEVMASPGSTLGCDFAGVVEEIGPKVTKQWKKGDRIAAFVHGGNYNEPEDGCFAEYVPFHSPLSPDLVRVLILVKGTVWSRETSLSRYLTTPPMKTLLPLASALLQPDKRYTKALNYHYLALAKLTFHYLYTAEVLAQAAW